MQILQFKPNLEYSDTFWELLKYDLFNFIIICKKENLHRIMKWVSTERLFRFVNLGGA